MALGKGPILVIGVTGRQGGAVAKQLLQHGFEVRGLTRDPSKPVAQEMQRRGAQLVTGDMDSAAVVKGAMNNARGVFSVQNTWEVGIGREVREGTIVADAAKDLGVEVFVYSSVGGAERQTGIPHFESKWTIEEHIRSIGLKAAVFRPVYFMDNLLQPDMKQAIQSGVLAFGLPPDVPLQMIAVADIGFFESRPFLNPDQWLGKELEIAGDELTMPQVAEALSRVLGHKVEYRQLPLDVIRQQSEDTATMLQWFIDAGYKADIGALRQMHPELLTFEQWLATVAWGRG